jgi:hypothetical protein
MIRGMAEHLSSEVDGLQSINNEIEVIAPIGR